MRRSEILAKQLEIESLTAQLSNNKSLQSTSFTQNILINDTPFVASNTTIIREEADEP